MVKNSAKRKIETVLSNRYAFLLAALLGFIIALPTLSSGLWMDDYQQRTTLLTTENGNPFEFYRMGTPQTDALLQSGVLPWWMHPTSKLVFFRPIAQWLMQLDYRWWPDNVPMMHLHSIVWYVVLVTVVGLTYRRFMPWPLGAGFAAVLFAIDAGHGGAVAWLANRNAMVAMTASTLSLWCYQKRQWYWQFLGHIFFAASMACAEAALAITGYFFAYEVFLSKQRWSLRILRLIPYAIIAVLWLMFWRSHDYGSAGPGFYTDPASDPGAFLRGMIYRAPAFLFGQLSIIPVEIFWVLEDSQWRIYAWAFVLIACGIFAKLLWPLIKESAIARFYVLGMCIATLPICGSQLVSRSLWYVSFGAIGLLALLFERFFFTMEKPARSSAIFSTTAFVKTLLVMHFAISPLLFLVGVKSGNLLDNYMDSHALNLPNAEKNNKTVLAISAPQFETNTYYPMLKDEALSLGSSPLRPKPSISKLRLLTNGDGEFELWRKSEDVLIARSDSGFIAMRKGKYGFRKGEQVMLDDVAITVLDITNDGVATEIEYRFKPGALNDYEVIAWEGNHFSPAQLPADGMKTIIKTTTSS